MGGKSTGILSDIIEKKGGFDPDETARQRSAALHEVAGLGVLAAPTVAQLAGHAAEHAHLSGPIGAAVQAAGRFAAHPFVGHPVELAGLGILARPSVQELRESPPAQKIATSVLAHVGRAEHPKQAAPEGEHGTGGSTNDYISTQDRAAWRKRFPEAQCTLAKDKDGYYCRTHRARSPSFASVGEIPERAVRFVSSTS